MARDNLKLFEMFASRVLAHVYENHPVRIDLEARAIVNQCMEVPTDNDERRRMNAIAGSTIAYLVDEGFLRAADPPEGPISSKFQRERRAGFTYFGVRLSERGLRLLDAIPTVVQEDADRRSPGERLADAVEGGHWKLASEAIREVMRISGRSER